MLLLFCARLAANAERERRRRAHMRAVEQPTAEEDLYVEVHLWNLVRAGQLVCSAPFQAWPGWPAAPGAHVPLLNEPKDRLALEDARIRLDRHLIRLQDDRFLGKQHHWGAKWLSTGTSKQSCASARPMEQSGSSSAGGGGNIAGGGSSADGSGSSADGSGSGNASNSSQGGEVTSWQRAADFTNDAGALVKLARHAAEKGKQDDRDLLMKYAAAFATVGAAEARAADRPAGAPPVQDTESLAQARQLVELMHEAHTTPAPPPSS